jgi:2-polyprenyl-6-methoxyphenol hydroxylase-like FAD-dependent oxidoreductase
VVGADGLHSAVRKATNGDDAVVNARYVCYRATVPLDVAAGTADGRDMVIWAGPRMHLVQYPVRRGTLRNLVACFESDQYTPAHDDWGTPDELDERFAIACDQVRTGVAQVERAQRWRMMDREPIQRWVYGRIALLGDAAHPMLQYVAQGACQALEDAVALGEAVGSSTDLNSALAAYQDKRVPRASRVQRTARQFGEILHLGAIGASMRREVLHNREADDYAYLDWLYAA